MLSASVPKGKLEITRAGNPKYMTTAVGVHNNSMVDVDLSDRRLASQATERKWVKKKNIQKDLLSFTQSVFNSFIIFQNLGKQISREKLIKEIFGTYFTAGAELKPDTWGHQNRNSII